LKLIVHMPLRGGEGYRGGSFEKIRRTLRFFMVFVRRLLKGYVKSNRILQ